MREPLHASTDLNKVPVCDSQEVPIGETYGVLCDAESGLVRFFDISLDGRDRHVLIPVGHARIEKHRGLMRLRLRAATGNELDDIPAYEPHVAWHEDSFQNELLDAFGRLFKGQRYYAHPAYDHTGLYAGMHPLLREGLAPFTSTGLCRLSAAREFRVADGEPNIKGWGVLGPNDERTGCVTDLVIDADAEQVRYIVVRRETDDKDVLVPIGYAEVKNGSIRTPFSIEDLLELPVFSEDKLDRSEEIALRLALDTILRGPRRYQRADFKSAA
jgi:hypothetical protein